MERVKRQSASWCVGRAESEHSGEALQTKLGVVGVRVGRPFVGSISLREELKRFHTPIPIMPVLTSGRRCDASGVLARGFLAFGSG